jgi:hypothetical protein
MTGRHDGGSRGPEIIPIEFQKDTSETRTILETVENAGKIVLATLLKAQEAHALALESASSGLKRFYEWSRPDNPEQIRSYMVSEMDALWAVLKQVDDDVHQFYSPAMLRRVELSSEVREQLKGGVDSVTKCCWLGTRAIRAAWDALSTPSATPEQYEVRAITRDKAVDTLNELAKQLRALAKSLSQISTLSRQSDSA